MAAANVIQNTLLVGAFAGAWLVGYLALDSIRTSIVYPKNVQPEQILKCSTGVGQSATLMGIGRITKIDYNTFKIERDDMPAQYLIKGDMDVCVIANLIEEPVVPEQPSRYRNIDG